MNRVISQNTSMVDYAVIMLYFELTSASCAHKNITCLTKIELGIYSTVIYCALTTFI